MQRIKNLCVGSAQGVVVARARAPRGAAVQHCLEYLGSWHPDFELEGSTRSVVQFEGVLQQVGLERFNARAHQESSSLAPNPKNKNGVTS